MSQRIAGLGRSGAVALCLVLLGCRADDVAPPELRRPLEDLPSGAASIVLTSDLRNTWQRAEAHQLWTVLQGCAPLRELTQKPIVVQLQSAIRAYETRTGSKVEDDLLLNALGDRAALGIYRGGASEDRRMSSETTIELGLGSEDDCLFIAELAAPDRFRTALAALRPEDFGGGVTIVEESLDGIPGWRLSSPEERSLLIVQREAVVYAATSDTLVRSALSVHGGGSSALALREPPYDAALRAIGPHNVVALAREGSGSGWMAQGFTWDPSGLHVEMLRTADAPATTTDDPVHRDDILRSIPDGMALACYARGSDLGLGGLTAALQGATGRQTPPLESRLPPAIRAVAGDEVGLAVLGVEPTAIAPIPNVALILELRDAEAATKTLRTLESAVGAVRIKGQGYDFEEVKYGGTTFRSLTQPISETMTPSWLVDGNLAIVTSTRALMQQIVDTRRTGKRTLLSDDSYRGFGSFVPKDAAAVAYADPARLRRTLEQLEPSTSHWSAPLARAVRDAAQIATLCEHFPASAVYAAREDDRFAVRGWAVEKK